MRGIEINKFCPEFQMGTVTNGFDARLANRPFLVLTFGIEQPWAPECRKLNN